MSDKIHILNRHCFSSDVSRFKERPKWFDREKIFNNLKKTINNENSILHIIYDESKGDIEKTFLKNEKNVKIINCGTEASSFIELLKYLNELNLNDNDIIYIVEDDYLHRENWDKIIKEGLNIGFSYVTLYDHFDKYTTMYSNLISKILISPSTHWRTTPSTTNTYASFYKTIKKDLDIHISYSQNTMVTRDHEKFLKLNENKKFLGSCIPGYSTHVETEWLSPIIKWENYV